MPSLVARVSLFVMMITVYVLFLSSMVSYFELAPTIETNIQLPLLHKQVTKPSTPPPTLPSSSKPSHSPLVGVHFLEKQADEHKSIVHPHAVFACDDCEPYFPSGIVLKRSVISPEPVVMRSGSLVRGALHWAYGVASRGVLSTYQRRKS